MKTTSKIFLILASTAVLAWLLPWIVGMAFPTAPDSPFALFSPITRSFVVSERENDRAVIYELTADKHERGRTLTREERDHLLPQQYYNVLSGRGELPETICGKAVSAQIFRYAAWYFVLNPREVNRTPADVYMMMESLPERMELTDATQVFRIGDEMEFVDMKTNQVLAGRSRRFTEMMIENGFTFPAIDLHANITTRKPYDEGYLMIDAQRRLYHVKQRAGRPYVRHVELADSIVPAKVFVTENPDHRILGFMTDTENRLYVIDNESYAVRRIPVDWNPTTDRIVVMANLFNWVIATSNEHEMRWTAIDNESLTLLDTYERRIGKTRTELIQSALFGYELAFTSLSDQYAFPRLTFHPLTAGWMAANVVLAVVVAIAFRRKRYTAMWSAVYVLVTGFAGFIPILLFRD